MIPDYPLDRSIKPSPPVQTPTKQTHNERQRRSVTKPKVPDTSASNSVRGQSSPASKKKKATAITALSEDASDEDQRDTSNHTENDEDVDELVTEKEGDNDEPASECESSTTTSNRTISVPTTLIKRVTLRDIAEDNCVSVPNKDQATSEQIIRALQEQGYGELSISVFSV